MGIHCFVYPTRENFSRLLTPRDFSLYRDCSRVLVNGLYGVLHPPFPPLSFLPFVAFPLVQVEWELESPRSGIVFKTFRDGFGADQMYTTYSHAPVDMDGPRYNLGSPQQPDYTISDQIGSYNNQTISDQIRSDQIRSDHIRSDQSRMRSYEIRPGQIRSCEVRPHQVPVDNRRQISDQCDQIGSDHTISDQTIRSEQDEIIGDQTRPDKIMRGQPTPVKQ